MKMKINMRMTAGFAAFFLMILTAAVLCCGCGAVVYESVADEESADAAVSGGAPAADPESEPIAPEEQNIVVYVCGAVRHTGVYELPVGSRVFEAIEAAGGLTDEADERAVNQAEFLTDGQQVTAPYEGEADETAAPGYSAGDFAGSTGGGGSLININTAGREELMRLSGIGEVRASDIIAYREANGPFGAIEDIMKVSGIKTSTFEKIRDSITV